MDKEQQTRTENQTHPIYLCYSTILPPPSSCKNLGYQQPENTSNTKLVTKSSNQGGSVVFVFMGFLVSLIFLKDGTELNLKILIT